MFSFDHGEWIEKHIEIVLVSACTIIVAWVIACFVMLAQVMDLNSRLFSEAKELRILVNTHEVKIKALAAENAWVREKVRIKFEVTN